MADKSHIEWTDATWNVITGCSVLSPGCTNCYAMRLAGTRLRNHPSRSGLTIDTKAGPVWTGEVRLNHGWLAQPLTWSKPRRIFVCAHADLFHENVPDDWIDKVFAVMALAPQHIFQILTKRPERMRQYIAKRFGDHTTNPGDLTFAAQYRTWVLMPKLDSSALGCAWPKWPLPNVWLGVSAERQLEADERIPHLLATPAAVRFLSAEPLLGPINLTFIEAATNAARALGIKLDVLKPPQGLDWVILGGENGPRPMHPDWARRLRDQCAAAGVPFFFKQWGSYRPAYSHPSLGIQESQGTAGCPVYWPDGSLGPGNARERGGPGQQMERVGKSAAGRLLDGIEHNGMPEIAQ